MNIGAGLVWVVAVGIGGAACGGGGSNRPCGDALAGTKCVAADDGSGGEREPFTVEVGQVCVTSSVVGDDGLGLVEVTARPKGCLSSALEQVEVACALTAGEGGALLLATTFRYRSGPLGSSLPDCSGGGVATCSVGGLPPGPVTVTGGGLSLPVAVPMPPRADGPVPAPGDCVGSQF